MLWQKAPCPGDYINSVKKDILLLVFSISFSLSEVYEVHGVPLTNPPLVPPFVCSFLHRSHASDGSEGGEGEVSSLK